MSETAKTLNVHAAEQEKTSSDASLGAPAAGLGQKSLPTLSEDQLKELQRVTEEATNTDNIFKGNDADVKELSDALSKLTPEELNQYMASLTDEQLKALGDSVAKDGKGLFNREGTTAFERQTLLSNLMAKLSPENVARLKDAVWWAQPDASSMGDAARTGGAKGDDSNKWMNPSGPVLGDKQSPADIRQGAYGDCVVMAGAGALINADENWANDHVTDNGNGTVTVKLYDGNGNPQSVTVTKDLPADSSGEQKGAKAGDGGNWAAYVEKALTQVYSDDDSNDGKGDKTYPPGEYKAIEGNYGPDVMKYLTGNESKTTSNADEAWNAVGNGKATIVSTQGTKPPGAPEGYYAGHEYFVVGTDSDNKLILQNPWGPENPPMHVTKDQFEELFQNATVRQ